LDGAQEVGLLGEEELGGRDAGEALGRCRGELLVDGDPAARLGDGEEIGAVVGVGDLTSSSARSRMLRPRRVAMPYSVTT
jgi:hypothetical protein